jgi:hypothetical protein
MRLEVLKAATIEMIAVYGCDAVLPGRYMTSVIIMIFA